MQAEEKFLEVKENERYSEEKGLAVVLAGSQVKEERLRRME